MGKVFHYVVTFDEDTEEWKVFCPDGVDFIPVNFENGEVFDKESGTWQHIMGKDIVKDEELIMKYDTGQSNLEDLIEEYSDALSSELIDADRVDEEEDWDEDDDE